MKLSAFSYQRSAKAVTLTFLLVACISAANAKDNPSPILGDWHGTSTCLVKPSACHDEEALYRFRADANGKLWLEADKMVNGKPEQMGEPAACAYDAGKKSLHCEFERGYVDLTLAGDDLNGAMFLTDKTRWRDIKLKRVK